MRSLFLSTVTSFALLSVFALPAPACYNDREVENAEREFKSSYEFKPSPGEKPAPESPSPSQDPAKEQMILGLGSALLVGAVVITYRKLR